MNIILSYKIYYLLMLINYTWNQQKNKVSMKGKLK
jgi:hypothetical protein